MALLASKLTRLRQELPWLAVVLAGSVAPLLAVLITGHTLAWRDTARLLAPMRSLIAEALRSGQLPLWNPYEAMGMPLFAQLLHGVLHPWSILVAFFTRDGIDLLIVLHVATGAAGAGVLARALGASKNGAAVAGLGYGLSGYLLSMSSILTYLAGAGTAPWAIAALCYAAGGPSRIALGSAAMAVLYFAGDPQWAIVAAIWGGLLAWSIRGWRGFCWAMGAVVMGTLLAAIQLIPTWEFLEFSTRSEGISLQDRMQWAFAPSRLLEFAVPGFFAGQVGSSSAPVFKWLGGESKYTIPFVPSVFIGIPVLALAFIGIKTEKTTRLLAGTAAVFMWLSLGHIAGADVVLGWVPVWNSFRYAEKLIGPFTLCIAVLAAFGLEPFVSRVNARPRRLFWWALAAAFLAAASAALANIASPIGGIPADAWNLAGKRLAWGFFLAAAGLAVIAIRACPRPEKPASLLGTKNRVLAIVLATGLCGSVMALHVGSPDSRETKPLSVLQMAEVVPRIISPVKGTACPEKECAELDYIDSLQAINSRVGYSPYNIPSKIDNIAVYTGLMPRRAMDVKIAFDSLKEGSWAAHRRFAATHVVLPPALLPAEEQIARAAIAGGRLFGVDPSWQISIFAVPHRPWAAFAERVVTVNSESEAISALVSSVQAGDDSVVLLGGPPDSLSRGIVHMVERSPSYVKILAEAPAPGLLVIADSFWDGWVAEIDGKPVDIHIADGVIRALHWPAGRHVLEMRYEPVEVKVGWVLSGMAAMLLLGLYLREKYGRRKCADWRIR